MAAEHANYRLSPLARADLEDIYAYTLKTWSSAQAVRYHNDIVMTFNDLASGRKSGRLVDIRDGYFKYAVGSHMVFFRHVDHGIDIMRILHQAMDVGRHLEP